MEEVENVRRGEEVDERRWKVGREEGEIFRGGGGGEGGRQRRGRWRGGGGEVGVRTVVM